MAPLYRSSRVTVSRWTAVLPVEGGRTPETKGCFREGARRRVGEAAAAMAKPLGFGQDGACRQQPGFPLGRVCEGEASHSRPPLRESGAPRDTTGHTWRGEVSQETKHTPPAPPGHQQGWGEGREIRIIVCLPAPTSKKDPTQPTCPTRSPRAASPPAKLAYLSSPPGGPACGPLLQRTSQRCPSGAQNRPARLRRPPSWPVPRLGRRRTSCWDPRGPRTPERSV